MFKPDRPVGPDDGRHHRQASRLRRANSTGEVGLPEGGGRLRHGQTVGTRRTETTAEGFGATVVATPSFVLPLAVFVTSLLAESQ